MLLDVTHQETNYHNGNHKRGDHTDQQHRRFHAGRGQSALHQLQQACPEHCRNRQKEGEFRRRCTGNAQQQCSHDRRTGTGSSRKDRRDQLKDADHQNGIVSQRGNAAHLRGAVLMPLFDPDKRDTKQNQHNGNCPRIVQVCLTPVVQQKPDHCRRHRCHDDLAPHLENVLFQACPEAGLCHGVRVILLAERPQLFPVDDDNRQNSSQLNHNVKHFLEIICCVQFQKFVQQNQMSSTADRKPFCNAFHNTENQGLDEFPNHMYQCPFHDPSGITLYFRSVLHSA